MRNALPIALVLVASVAVIAAEQGRGTGQRGTGAGGQRGGGGTPPGGQQPVFRGSTELVQVDVVVRDRDGNPIHGLTAADFQVFDRKSVQSVEVFKEIRRTVDATPSFASYFPASMKLDVASNRSATSERLIVMVLDDLHAYRKRDDKVKEIARKVVEDLGPHSSMALVMTSGRHNVEVTSDRSRLLEAIAKFQGDRLVPRPMLAVDGRRGGDLQEFQANMDLYGALRGAARVLGANDGRRKAFVLVSESVAKELSGLFGVTAAPGEPPPEGYGVVADPAEVLNRTPVQPYHDNALLDMMEAMRRGNVATYSIDPRGLVTPQELMRECHPSPPGVLEDPCLGEKLPDWYSWVRQAQHGLEIISAASGGFAVVNTDDFATGVDRIMSDLDNYYMLGFYTGDNKTKGYRPLEVRVPGHADYVLRYRRGYDLGRQNEEPKNKSALLALTEGALPETALPLRVGATPLPTAGKEARVPVTIEVTVPRDRLQGTGATLQDDIKYALLAVDMRGGKVKEATGYAANMVLRPRDPSLPPPDSVIYQIGETLTLAPGRYQLRVSTSSAKADVGGSVYLPLDVPDFSKPALAVSGLVVGYAGGPRVPSLANLPASRGRGAARGPGPGRSMTTTSKPIVVVPEVPFPPTLDREFEVRDEIALYFEIVRRDKTSDVPVSVSFVDRQDRVVRKYDQKIPPTSNGKISVRLPLKEVGPGAFRVRVTLHGQGTEAVTETAIIVK